MKKFDSSEKINQLLKRKQFLMNELERIRLISLDMNSELWKYQNEKCIEQYDEIEVKLFEFEKLSDREILILLCTRKQIIKFMSTKDYINMKDSFSEELKTVNDSITEYRSKQS